MERCKRAMTTLRHSRLHAEIGTGFVRCEDWTLGRGLQGRRIFQRSLERQAFMSVGVAVGDALQALLKSLTAVGQLPHHLKQHFFGSMADEAEHGSANRESMRDGRDEPTAGKAPASLDDAAHMSLPVSQSAVRPLGQTCGRARRPAFRGRPSAKP